MDDIKRRIAEQLQVFDIDLLAAIHRGEVDVAELARRELANRGVSPEGKWVGFPEAARLVGIGAREARRSE